MIAIKINSYSSCVKEDEKVTKEKIFTSEEGYDQPGEEDEDDPLTVGEDEEKTEGDKDENEPQEED